MSTPPPEEPRRPPGPGLGRPALGSLLFAVAAPAVVPGGIHLT